ncbi:MAG TPA: cellulase family glycosylhydrolase [Opitutaceae bacterium]|nr:cellulase family glycosylhydrolase [Opitutaceae bacterium]
MKRLFPLRGFVLALLGFAAVAGRAVEPVQFVFRLPPDDRNPYARNLWAEVLTPSQAILRLPAFFYGDGQFAVRARATEAGEYRLGTVSEKFGDRMMPLPATAMERVRQTVKQPAPLPQVTGYRGQPARFLSGDGQPFTPIGANIAWASSDRMKFHLRAISEFNQQGLNWMRIWMSHWGGLNLEWLPPDRGKSPARGLLDLQVAADWDKIVAAAEEKNVYLQIVLQHHGQYSTTVNPNWKEHPWNAANRDGFLASPGEFFTSELAIGLTALKYRYIIARWGYSPAVLAWELFNEVHWTDPINQGHDDTTVAQWHDAMADYIRGLDHYRHLVTTSTEDLRSPIYARMDFYQPHLYAQNMLAGARQFAVPADALNRPVFYGEVGDDHMDLTAAQKESGIAIVPPVWASLMGQGPYAAQPWLGEKLILGNRLGELGAVARFLHATGLGRRENLTPFSSVVECDARVPFVLTAGQVWQRRSAPEFTVPLDGREPVEFADVPRSYVGPEGLQRGFPGRATYHIEFPREMSLRARVVNVSPKGAAVRISVDGKVAAEKSWTPPVAATPTKEKPAILPFTVSAGRHTLMVENPGESDWFELAGIDFPHTVPALASIGQRGKDFLTLWVWHREGVFALKPLAAASGTLLLGDVPAGTWQVTWWNTFKGTPAEPTTVVHSGGTLKLPTPPIDRHAAVVLTLTAPPAPAAMSLNK